MERRPAGEVALVDAVAALQQRLRRLELAVDAGRVQRRLALLVALGREAALADEAAAAESAAAPSQIRLSVRARQQLHRPHTHNQV